MGKSTRIYRITGGTINGSNEVSCIELAKYSGLPLTTIYSRLSRRVFDLEKLTKPVIKRQGRPKKTKVVLDSTNKILMNKPFYDQSEAGVLWRLAMRTI
jgi:hypothetical protein